MEESISKRVIFRDGLERDDHSEYANCNGTRSMYPCEMVQYYMERIANFDQKGPHINSVLEINPDALHLAEASDAERRNGHVRGPMHGIPVLLKDNFETADRMHTSAGSIALDIRLSRTEGIDFVLKKNRLDALVFPKDKGDDIVAKAGYPSVAVKGGSLREGRPFGIMFTGTAFSEATLIKIRICF